MKPSQPLMARLRLTTKQVNGGYYKGNRTGSMGAFDKKGRYVLDYRKVRTYVVPEGLAQFNLTPFVTKSFQPTPTKYMKAFGRPRAFAAGDYIDLWKNTNATEVKILKENGGEFPEPKETAEEKETESFS
ncbi:50S ribosomal protein YmL27 [Talaromyces islandicus]|uniref:50S ribosomal protein YmL27 n=1 Tax=Talaromyces islandicus TaxID=28573 RepID=A0A0U1M3X2_TALIS|nr:50S ribosomal protein YmL27 [Talaromyces islandicus]